MVESIIVRAVLKQLKYNGLLQTGKANGINEAYDSRDEQNKAAELLRVDSGARSELARLDEQEPEAIQKHRDIEVQQTPKSVDRGHERNHAADRGRDRRNTADRCPRVDYVLTTG